MLEVLRTTIAVKGSNTVFLPNSNIALAFQPGNIVVVLLLLMLLLLLLLLLLLAVPHS